MKKLFIMFMVAIFSMSLITSAYAANVCGSISGNAKKLETFEVNTGERWFGINSKITFTQTKGTYEYMNLVGNYKTTTGYAGYKVMYREKGTSAWTTKNWKDKKITISLKNSKTYEVCVRPFDNTEWFMWKTRQNISWSTPSEWSVTGTKGVDFCS